ncbi:MAG: sensor histidine kinase [Pseudomonadota bacterium]
MDIQDGFEVKIPDDIPEIFSSYTSVQQVFSNLIINALKHHDQNKGCVEVEWGKMGDMMHFTVRDDGAGIEKEHQDRVFEMFQTLNARDKVEGSGLGLSIIKKLVEGQGGQIWIETEDKKRGTAMHFTWPKTYQENAI